MPLRVPYRRLAAEFLRAVPGGRQLGDRIDRNFAEIERSAGHWDTLSGTTDTTGYLTVTHGAGFTPTIVLVTPISPISGDSIFAQVIADSFTDTTFRIRCLGNTGSALNTIAVTGSFHCI